MVGGDDDEWGICEGRSTYSDYSLVVIVYKFHQRRERVRVRARVQVFFRDVRVHFGRQLVGVQEQIYVDIRHCARAPARRDRVGDSGHRFMAE